jgi:heat shock protein HtpX
MARRRKTSVDVPSSARLTGWRGVDRRLFRHALARDEALVTELTGHEPTRPGRSLARAGVTAAAVVIQLVAIGSLAFGAWLSSRNFPGVGLLPGVVLLAFGALLLPRPPGLPRYATRLHPDDAPDLFAFVGRVAQEVGVRCPDLIVVDDRFAADGGTAGLLRRRYLRLGVPLLAALDPRQRAGLVAHQLAHFTNGDPLRGPVVGSVDRSMSALVALFEPRKDTTLRAFQDPAILKAQAGIGGVANTGTTVATVWYAELLLRPITAVLRWASVLGWYLLAVLAKPDVHRAEYHADAVAARVAGADAVLEVFDVLTLRESVLTVLRRHVRAADTDTPAPAQWRTVVRQVLDNAAAQLPQLRAAALPESTSPFADHPPLPHRARLLQTQPATEPALRFTDADCAAMDTDLADEYRRFARDLRNG